MDKYNIYSCKYYNPWNHVDKSNDKRLQGEVFLLLFIRVKKKFSLQPFIISIHLTYHKYNSNSSYFFQNIYFRAFDFFNKSLSIIKCMHCDKIIVFYFSSNLVFFLVFYLTLVVF